MYVINLTNKRPAITTTMKTLCSREIHGIYFAGLDEWGIIERLLLAVLQTLLSSSPPNLLKSICHLGATGWHLSSGGHTVEVEYLICLCCHSFQNKDFLKMEMVF